MLGVLTFTTKEAPDGSVRGTAVRGHGPASAPDGAGADDGRGGGVGAGPDRQRRRSSGGDGTPPRGSGPRRGRRRGRRRGEQRDRDARRLVQQRCGGGTRRARVARV